MNTKTFKKKGLHQFFLLWSTQSLSILGSTMTSFMLIIWSYQQSGSALSSAMLAICTYAPYVVLSMFAGSFADRWDKKKVMLVCDTLAALSTMVIIVLYQSQQLQLWHVYVLNFWTGIMETIQQPVSDVAVSLLAPSDQYQKVGGLRNLSSSLTSVLSPVIATSVMGFVGIQAVFYIDFITFLIAFITLFGYIHIPSLPSKKEKESIRTSLKSAFAFLKENRGILDLILFLATINLCASMYNAALPAMALTRNGGSASVLAGLTTCTGLANVIGSSIVLTLRPPKNRIRVICNALLFSMSTENFLLAFGRVPQIWYLGAILGWLSIPIMNTNMDVVLRSNIPIDMQGRVYAARNSLQFFTIPIGYLVGGFLVDYVMEPYMASQQNTIFTTMLGSGKGSGAALLFLFLAFFGIGVCLFFRRDRHIWKLEDKTKR